MPSQGYEYYHPHQESLTAGYPECHSQLEIPFSSRLETHVFPSPGHRRWREPTPTMTQDAPAVSLGAENASLPQEKQIFPAFSHASLVDQFTDDKPS